MYYVDAKHLSFPHKHYFPIFVCVKVNNLYIFCTPFRWWPRYIKAPLVFLLPNQKCFHLDPREREKCSTLYIRLNKNFWNALPCISRASLPYPIWQLVTGLYKSLTSSVSRQYAKQKMVKLRAIYRVSRSADHFSKHKRNKSIRQGNESPKGQAWILVLQGPSIFDVDRGHHPKDLHQKYFICLMARDTQHQLRKLSYLVFICW